MTRTVMIRLRKDEQVAQEITLPIYRRQDLCASTDFTCIYPDLSTTTINVHDHGRQYEITHCACYNFDAPSSVDFHLGRGIYASSSTQFTEALGRCQDFLGSLVVKHLALDVASQEPPR